MEKWQLQVNSRQQASFSTNWYKHDDKGKRVLTVYETAMKFHDELEKQGQINDAKGFQIELVVRNTMSFGSENIPKEEKGLYGYIFENMPLQSFGTIHSDLTWSAVSQKFSNNVKTCNSWEFSCASSKCKVCFESQAGDHH